VDMLDMWAYRVWKVISFLKPMSLSCLLYLSAICMYELTGTEKATPILIRSTHHTFTRSKLRHKECGTMLVMGMST
jgi:hypothetical protein